MQGSSFLRASLQQDKSEMFHTKSIPTSSLFSLASSLSMTSECLPCVYGSSQHVIHVSSIR